MAGIDVGHRFYSRAEMVAVGFHSHWLNGIDYMGQSYRKGEYENYIFPLVVAIVLSGMMRMPWGMTTFIWSLWGVKHSQMTTTATKRCKQPLHINLGS